MWELTFSLFTSCMINVSTSCCPGAHFTLRIKAARFCATLVLGTQVKAQPEWHGPWNVTTCCSEGDHTLMCFIFRYFASTVFRPKALMGEIPWIQSNWSILLLKNPKRCLIATLIFIFLYKYWAERSDFIFPTTWMSSLGLSPWRCRHRQCFRSRGPSPTAISGSHLDQW